MGQIIRLDRFFSSQNLASRKEVRTLLKEGRITVNGQPVRQSDHKVDLKKDTVCLDGTAVGYKEYLYLMLNKPQGVVSATNDRTQKTVLDLVPKEFYRPGLFPAGRLDKDTTGFVLITDDGDLAHRILSPKSHVPKTYHAVLDRPFQPEMIEKFKEGVTLADGFTCLPAEIRTLQEGENPLVEIIIREGKYHQIKRMAAACGCHVIKLKRVKIGNLELDATLPEGACKEILHKDVEKFL
jgi:16S rRNA pseudouridine516 synthase